MTETWSRAEAIRQAAAAMEEFLTRMEVHDLRLGVKYVPLLDENGAGLILFRDGSARRRILPVVPGLLEIMRVA